MSEIKTGTGQCLCGAVYLSVTKMGDKIGACHCNMCRKWSGGPLLAIDCGTDVSFTGEENIGVFNSSDWADRGFCQQCGTHLFYRLKENQQYFMPAGLFDNCDTAIFDHQVFIDEKPDYYEFANETNNMTGAELFAQFAASADT